MESLEIDGDELLDLRLIILAKMLAKNGADDATGLAQRVISQRDTLLPDRNVETASAITHPVTEASEDPECPFCMEIYVDDEEGMLAPRVLTTCGHTACNGCLADLLTRVNAVGNSKPLLCPSCYRVTKVSMGQTSRLPKHCRLLRM